MKAEQVRKNKIACVILIYFDFGIIQKSLDFYTQFSDQLDIYIVENHSEHTDSQIAPYIQQLLSAEKVTQYFLFERNITMNALEVVVDQGQIPFSEYQYVMITEGDLLVEKDGWLQKQCDILKNHPQIFACGIGLDDRNLPINVFPNAREWIDDPTAIEHDDYIQTGAVGLHLLLMRPTQFLQFLDYRKKTGGRFRDTLIRAYAKRQHDMGVAIVKEYQAIHLIWDVYNDPTHPYSQRKFSQSADKLWHHYDYCRYSVYGSDGLIATRFPLSSFLRAFYKRLWKSFRFRISRLLQ